MQLLLSPSVIVEAGTALGILIAAIYLPWRDNSRRASIIGSVLMITAALWILTHSLEIGTPVSSDKAYLMGLQLVWGLIAMTLWLVYILHYIAPRKWQISRIYILFGIMPLLAILAVTTNNIHGLIWTDPGLDINNPYLPLQPVYGLFYWVCMAYIGVMTVFGVFLIFNKVVRQSNLRRWEPWTLILAALIPLLSAFLEITGLIQVTDLTIGITPFFSGLGVIILIGSLPRFQLKRIVPVAQAIVFESISDGVVVLDMQNHIIELNPAAEHLAGCTSSEALGLPVEQIWPNWPSQLLLSKPVSAVYEELILTRDGEQRTYNLHIYVIPDHENHPMNKLVLLSDATERKQAEEKLRLGDAEKKALLNALPDPVVLHGPDLKFIWVNKAAEKVFGKPKDELIGKTCYETVFNLKMPHLSCPTLKAIESGVGSETLMTFSDRVLEVRCEPVLDDSGRVTGVLETMRDITERKQMEEEGERYRGRLESLHELVLQLDTAQTIDQTAAIASDVIQSLYGADFKGLALVEGDALVKLPAPGETMPPTRLPLDGKDVMVKVVKEAQTIYLEDTSVNLDYFKGNTKPLSELVVPLKVKDQVVGVLNLESKERNAYKSDDIKLAETLASHILATLNRISLTEKQQRALEAALREEAKAERAQELDAVKTRFYSSATHEIRTPLTSITGYTELVQNALQSGDVSKLPVYFDAVKRNAERLTRLTDDLLDTQRIAEGRLRISRSPVKTSDLLRDLIQESIPGLTRRGQTLEVRDEFDSVISVDRDRVIQVLANLVGNASKFSPQGATIHLCVEERDGEALFSVRDDGVGVARDDVPKLFNPFPGILIEGNTESTGLGLSISRGIVELHGGRIWAESGGPGKGSMFSFTVPVVES